MKNKDWAKIARLYNGPNYKKNNYDQKMKDNYGKQNIKPDKNEN
jgi:hypothetical protein